jgi:hypothetical protein
MIFWLGFSGVIFLENTSSDIDQSITFTILKIQKTILNEIDHDGVFSLKFERIIHFYSFFTIFLMIN